MEDPKKESLAKSVSGRENSQSQGSGGGGGDGPAHLKNRITVAVAEMDGERCREGHIYATGDGRK